MQIIPDRHEIIAARQLLRWTQICLAQKSGVSGSTIKRIEIGRLKPSLGTMDSIVAAFKSAGVSFELVQNAKDFENTGPQIRLRRIMLTPPPL